MEHFYQTFCLEVEGEFACFTRPEMKVERVSYDVITPSAARGIFESILWKPSLSWQIKKIEVLNPIRWTSIRRNEVGSYMSHRSDGVYIEDSRQQRAGLLLRDVRYRIHAELRFNPDKGESRQDENPGKYNAMFERRAKKGQCFNQPYLGCREFSCRFTLIETTNKDEPQPIPEDKDLGFMLYDMQFPKPDDKDQEIHPAFYRPRMKQGVIEVPDWTSEEVYR
ncbi:type I-C CRISPR-associated protein Cas5c [Spirochaeta lutea]|uniref:pre-crRNA processing endonuclease n=1 Tax=Spirochaeta lutea TaxID=1480694 RepID=A0A098R0A4_9SPIO|nr:type I-C CRISPR-associated protein Cas5c [Spirochaeta lutea]KGE72162.1 CRISPR-associated protein [Spirochaeta lutea]